MKLHDKKPVSFLPLQVRTAYAQVLERLEDLEAGNLAAALSSSCSLLVKKIGAREYAYAQRRPANWWRSTPPPGCCAAPASPGSTRSSGGSSIGAVPALHGARFMSRRGEFKVEFITPLVGRDLGKKVILRQFGVPALPLRFLDHLIERSQPALALGRRPMLVRVPFPARYAVHKLIVSQERRSVPLKSQKDLEQSFDLQRVLATLDPEGLEEAFRDARQRGPGWAQRVDPGMRAMTRVFGSPDR